MMGYSNKRYYDNILTFGRKRLGLYLIVVVVQLLSYVLLFCDPMDYIACQAPLSMGFSRQEYWSALLFPLETVRSCFQGPKELGHHSPLYLSAETNSARGKVIDEKWFIRIFIRFTSGQASLHCPEYSVGYIFIIRGRQGRGRRSFSFLSRCHVSIISSSTRQSGEVFLSLYGQAQDCHRTLEKYFQVSVQ